MEVFEHPSGFKVYYRKINRKKLPGGPKKRPELCVSITARTLWGEISFGTFVDQYVLLLTYQFQ